MWKQRKENAILSGLFNPRIKTEISSGQRLKLSGLYSCTLLLLGSTVKIVTQ